MSPAMASVLASTITIGNHWKPFGLNINMDDVLGALVAGVIVIGMGSYLAAKVTPGVPGRLQAIYESIIDAITRVSFGLPELPAFATAVVTRRMLRRPSP